MNYFWIIVCLLLWNFFGSSITAQDKPIVDACPVLSVVEPSAVVEPGENMIFTAKVTGNASGITYNWTVDKGVITAGQGTPTITVATDGLEGETVIATVSITGGFLNVCDSEESGAGIVSIKPKARLFEKLENPNCEYHMMVMDTFFNELGNDPTASAYIITYADSRRTAVSERQMRSYMKARNVDMSRFIFINGGGASRKPTIEFWIAPAGAVPPTPIAQTGEIEEKIEPEIKKDPIDKRKPYVFSSEYYDGVDCYGESSEMDLDGYAQILGENPKNRGNIVITLPTKAEFRRKEREILNFLTSRGIARKRLKTFHVKSFGGVELWLLP